MEAAAVRNAFQAAQNHAGVHLKQVKALKTVYQQGDRQQFLDAVTNCLHHILFRFSAEPVVTRLTKFVVLLSIELTKGL